MLVWLILVLLLLIYIWVFCAQAVPDGPLGTLLLLFGYYKILVFSQKSYPGHPGFQRFRALGFRGCKESQFYSLPFGQAVTSMYQPESHFNQPGKNLMSRIDYSSSLIRIPKKIHSPNSKIQQPGTIGHYFLSTLVSLIFLIAQPFHLTSRMQTFKIHFFTLVT